MLIDLGDAACRDPRRVGAKAAWLARARAAGLPVLPGAVVPGEYARSALQVGAEQAVRRGSGAARLAVMETAVDEGVVAALAERTELYPAIVRSSSELDADGSWAGAFSSFDEIGCTELGTAIRGVWASAFNVDTLERCEHHGYDPSELTLGVLVQPHTSPECGGTATVCAGSEVEVVATDGPLSGLTSGWVPGSAAAVRQDGRLEGGVAVERFGAAPLRAAAELALACWYQLGHDTIEWAWSGGEVVLLQSGTFVPATPATLPAAIGVTHDLAVRLARAAVAYPGALGHELVMPWFAATGHGLDHPPSSPPSRQPLDDLDVAANLAADLTKQAWDGEDPAPTVRALLGPDASAAVARLERLDPVDDATARRLASLLAGVAEAVAQYGWVARPAAAWRLSVAELRARLAGDCAGLVACRPGPDRWEPFVHATVVAAGATAIGDAAAPGVGAGRVVVVDDPSEPPVLSGREVLVAKRPEPRLAPLLWTASALVTSGGNAGAHLVGVARAVGVPAVVAARLNGHDELLHGAGVVAAVDGSRGRVSYL